MASMSLAKGGIFVSISLCWTTLTGIVRGESTVALWRNIGLWRLVAVAGRNECDPRLRLPINMCRRSVWRCFLSRLPSLLVCYMPLADYRARVACSLAAVLQYAT